MSLLLFQALQHWDSVALFCLLGPVNSYTSNLGVSRTQQSEFLVDWRVTFLLFQHLHTIGLGMQIHVWKLWPHTHVIVFLGKWLSIWVRLCVIYVLLAILCVFLSFIKLNRYIMLHTHWWRYIYRHVLILYLHRHDRTHGTSASVSAEAALGTEPDVPRGVAGISLSHRSVQARQHGQLAPFLRTLPLWEIPDLSCCWDLISRVRSTSNPMTLALWGCIFHPPQRNNTSGEDITGFDNPWPVCSQFGHCLNSPVVWSQWLENLIQVSVTRVAVSGFALCLRTPSPSAPRRTMPAFSSCCRWHWSWMSQISDTWESTVRSSRCATAEGTGISVLPCAGRLPTHWAAGSPELLKSPAPFFPGQQPTVWQYDTKYTIKCQLGFCQMMWHIWSEGCQNIISVPRKICLVSTAR